MLCVFSWVQSTKIKPLLFLVCYFLIQRLLSNEEEKNRAIIQEVCFMVSFSWSRGEACVQLWLSTAERLLGDALSVLASLDLPAVRV